MTIIKINNFKIIYNRVKKSKTTLVEAYINNGSIFETRENAGISHLLEHIVTEGWKKCGGPCSQYWSKRGVTTNASTGQTFVNYYMHGLEKYSDDMMEYIAGIAMKPIMTQKRICKEKKAVRNELLMNKTFPDIEIFDALNKILFKLEGLKLQDDIDHQLKLLSKFNKKDLREWLDTYYVPGNIIFVVSGDISIKSIERIFKKKLNKFKENKVMKPQLDIFKVGLHISRVKTSKKGATVLFAFPSPLSQQNDEIHLIKLFEKLVNSDVTSILFDKLREKENLIYNLQVEEFVYGYGSYIVIKTQCENKDIEKVILFTIEVLKKISSGKFDKTGKLLKSIKELYLVDYYNTCKKDLSSLSTLIGEQYINQINNTNTTKVYDFEEITNKIRKVSSIEFINFVKKLLIFGNLKIIYQSSKEIPNLQSLVQDKI
jgi:predicted Zn-dependent peptidase